MQHHTITPQPLPKKKRADWDSLCSISTHTSQGPAWQATAKGGSHTGYPLQWSRSRDEPATLCAIASGCPPACPLACRVAARLRPWLAQRRPAIEKLPDRVGRPESAGICSSEVLLDPRIFWFKKHGDQPQHKVLDIFGQRGGSHRDHEVFFRAACFLSSLV